MNERSFMKYVMGAGRNTKELIERAALKLFVERGVAETSIKDIARDAGVSQGAMYNHYDSKEELAWLLFSDNFTEIGADLRQIAREESDLRSKLRSITTYIFNRYDRDPTLISYCFLVRHMHLMQVRTRMGNPYLVIRSIIEGETRRQNIRPQELEVASSLVTGAIMQMIDMRIYGSLKGSLAQHANAVADACVTILEA
jgi:AcrR family transcriptional regulator